MTASYAANHWGKKRWGDLVSLEYGKGIRDYDREYGKYRVYGSNGPIGWHSESLINGPGVILGRKGAYRGVHYSSDNFSVIDTAYYVLPRIPTDMRWLYYAMLYHKVGEINDGSPIPSTTRSAVYKSELIVPPLEEQASISKVLSCIDDKIEAMNYQNEILDKLAQLFFKDWFIDFGPTRAKMVGQAPYITADIWSLFPSELDDTGQPTGWSQSSIGDEVDIAGGSTPSTTVPDYWGGEIAWATPKDLSPLTAPVLLSTERRITEAGLTQIGSGLLPAGTVLLSSRAPIGYLAVTQIPSAINQGFIAMRCNKRVSMHFAWLWTNAHMDVIKQKANGSTFQEISKSSFRTIPVLLPTDALLSAFEEVIAPLFSQIVSNEKETRDLAETRDFLLPKLMSGELRVGNSA